MSARRLLSLFLLGLIVAVVAAASTPTTGAQPPLHTKQQLGRLAYSLQNHGTGGNLSALNDGSGGNGSAATPSPPSMSDLGGTVAEHGAIIAGLSIAVTTLIAAVAFFCYHSRKSKPSPPASPPPSSHKASAGTQAHTFEYKNRPLPPLPVVILADEKYGYGQGYDYGHAASLAEVKALFPTVKDSGRGGEWVGEWVGRHARPNAQARLDVGGGVRSPIMTPPAFRQHPGVLVSFVRTPEKW